MARAQAEALHRQPPLPPGLAPTGHLPPDLVSQGLGLGSGWPLGQCCYSPAAHGFTSPHPRLRTASYPGCGHPRTGGLIPAGVTEKVRNCPLSGHRPHLCQPLTLDPKAHFPPGSVPHTLSPTGGPARQREVDWSINHYFCSQEPSTPFPVGPSGGVSREGVAPRPEKSHLSLPLSSHVSLGARPTLPSRLYRRPTMQGAGSPQLRPMQTRGPRDCAWCFPTLASPSLTPFLLPVPMTHTRLLLLQ